MKTDKDLMNKVAHGKTKLRVLTAEESSAMKKVLMDIYKDISSLCNRHKLTYMLAGGSCLGAIRHNGFIPWDDDLDMIMPREDYEKFIALCEQGEMGAKYEMTYPCKERDTKNLYIKVYRKNSLNLEIMCDNEKFPNGLYIDVFPMDGVPNSIIMQKIKGFIADAFHFMAVSVLYAQYPSASMKEFVSNNKVLKRRYMLRMAIGRIMGIIPHRLWAYWYDLFVKCNTQTAKVGIPTGRKHYCGEILPRDVFFPPIKAAFEDIMTYIPHDYDRYLRNLYGDYMQIPPVEKRERHFVIDFKLPEN